MPCSQTPVDLRAGPVRVFALQHLGVAFRQLQRRRLQRRYFGAPSHGLHTRCLRFAARVDLWTTQDSLPAGGQPCPGGLRETHAPRGSGV